MSWIVNKLSRAVFYRSPLGEILTVMYSLYLHLRFSFNNRAPEKDRERLKYYLVKHCHVVEKGLALPAPRLGFGESKIKNIICNARDYERLYGRDEITTMLRDMLRAYLRYHDQKDYALPAEFEILIKTFNAEAGPTQKGGLRILCKEKWSGYSLEKYNEFVSCRHSVRDFSDIPVSDEKMRDIIETGMIAPSVCNRQGWMVHYYRDKSRIKELLGYQNGNAGFSECIEKLLIVTGNAKAFTRYEHYQLFIDGGLLSMNIMFALHAAGLGACPLNTCMPFGRERELKIAAGIPKYEKLIMMIAVGSLKDTFSVAQSEKYKLDDVLRTH